MLEHAPTPHKKRAEITIGSISRLKAPYSGFSLWMMFYTTPPLKTACRAIYAANFLAAIEYQFLELDNSA